MIESYLTAILNNIRAIRAVKLGADILAFSNIQIQFRRGYIPPDLTSNQVNWGLATVRGIV